MINFRKFFNKKYNHRIDPDEIFLDATNLPGFDTYQFEGRIERPVAQSTFLFVDIFFAIVVAIFTFKSWSIQITNGENFANRSANNHLRHSLVFSDRGIIYDKNLVPLAWNEDGPEEFSVRKYIEKGGFASLLGYVSYPKKDSAGFYYDKDIEGVTGVEKFFNNVLQPKNGLRIIETDAHNNAVSENIIRTPEPSENIQLTIDAEMQSTMYDALKNVIDTAGYVGGGAAVMDIYTGELLVLTNYPEYDSNILADGSDHAAINRFLNDKRNPFLNRVVDGLYAPGSIVKPYVAVGALQERIINTTDKIVSTEYITVPNPYNPDNPTLFRDYQAYGPVNIREALAHSSNIFFYTIGGGREGFPGLGITRVEQYFQKFGFGSEIRNPFFAGASGTIPNPEWKRKVFDDEWRLGDTYYTVIGQYGVQVTPLQILRGVAAIANRGTLVEPQIFSSDKFEPMTSKIAGVDDWVWSVVQAGMRDAVLFGTATGVKYDDIQIASKTGTAEIGVRKDRVNAWHAGFFPYQNPKYAYVVFLESGVAGTRLGSNAVSRQFFDWLKVARSEIFQ